jgi:predicted ArsR family transcriptional regulator
MSPVASDEAPQRLGPSRARVLALLQDAGEPMGALDVSDRLEMRPSTARFHLDALAASGLVVRDREARTTPGRPRVTYAATATAPDVTQRRYRLLAGMLARFLEDQLPDPGAAAIRTGQAWGQSLASPAVGDQRVTEAQALEVLVDVLDEVGFESRAAGKAGSSRIEVSHCPFLEVAEEHQDVVCAMHLGLMRGVLARIEAPVEVRALEPLVEPSLCVARISS